MSKILSRLATAAIMLALAAAQAQARWVTAWESAIAALDGRSVDGQTVRQFAQVSAGGARVRVTFSNLTGTAPLCILDAHVAVATGTAGTVDTATNHALTFGGAAHGIVAVGATVTSDPVDMSVKAQTRLAVSAQYLTRSTVAVGHLIASETNYIAPGDHAAEAFMSGGHPSRSGFYVNNVVVDAPIAGSVVTFGDSITDGLSSTVDRERRWTDTLTSRLLARPAGPIATSDAGITCNAVLTGAANATGFSGASRFARDALNKAGVHWVILLEGVNDLTGGADPDEAAFDLIAAYRAMIDEAHAVNVKVFGGTILPFGAAASMWTPARERARSTVNAWIRASGAFDGVVDFDAALRWPNDPTKLRPAWDSGDGIHPNDTGYAMMGNTVPLDLFR